MKNIIVLTSGGDAPGMNAAIRAVVRAGHFFDLKIFGSLSGFHGWLMVRVSSIASAGQPAFTVLAGRAMILK